MRPKTATKYSLFLVFLTLGQEFSAAYRLSERSSQHRWPADSLNQPRFQEPRFSEPLRYGEDFKGFENKRSENETGVAEVVTPQKRWVAAVALGVSVGVSLLGIGFEVYLKLEGCCGLYKEICEYIKEFKLIQKRLPPMFKQTDFAALTAKNTLEDVTQTNYRLIEIWNDMKRIRDLKVQFLVKLSASTIKSFNTKWAEIEGYYQMDTSSYVLLSRLIYIKANLTYWAQLKNANNTVRHLTYSKLSAEFQSYFDDYKLTLLAFTPIMAAGLGLLAIPAFRSYKQQSLNKEIARLSTGDSYKQLVTARHGKAAKILGVQNINQHIKATATSRNNARFATGKYTKYIVGGIGVVSTLVGVGVEIYAAFQKITHCKTTVRDNAKKGLDDVKKGETMLKSVYKNVSDYISLIDTRGVQYFRDQLTSERLLVELESIRQLAKGAGQKAQSQNLTIAANNINAFIVGIREANAKKTYNLTANLADGLARIKFLYTCYIAKVGLTDYCTEQCKNGTNSLDNIYAAGAKHFEVNAKECHDDVGVPYYSLQDMKFSLNKTAAKGNFSTDCILNNKDRRDKVCRSYHVDGYKKADIEKREGLSPAQVDYFLARCKSYKKELTPKQKDTICFMRGLGASDEAIYAENVLPSYVTLAEIKAVTCSTQAP